LYRPGRLDHRWIVVGSCRSVIPHDRGGFRAHIDLTDLARVVVVVHEGASGVDTGHVGPIGSSIYQLGHGRVSRVGKRVGRRKVSDTRQRVSLLDVDTATLDPIRNPLVITVAGRGDVVFRRAVAPHDPDLPQRAGTPGVGDPFAIRRPGRIAE